MSDKPITKGKVGSEEPTADNDDTSLHLQYKPTTGFTDNITEIISKHDGNGHYQDAIYNRRFTKEAILAALGRAITNAAPAKETGQATSQEVWYSDGYNQAIDDTLHSIRKELFGEETKL